MKGCRKLKPGEHRASNMPKALDNYRKLAPGEVIRVGDLVNIEDTGLMEASYIKEVGNVAHSHQCCTTWRKARTDGCPPGWRWADAGEECEHSYLLASEEWEPERREVVRVRRREARHDSGREWVALMPYLEDPRLKEEE